MKILKTFFKIFLSLLAIYIVFSQIELLKVWEIISGSNPYYLLIAFSFYTLSRFAGSQRLAIYFEKLSINLGAIFNLKLYYLGMFYNLFLPGGIGGDGYKIYFLNKNFGTKVKDLLAATLYDRVGGLFALIVLTLFFCFFSSFEQIYKIGFFGYFVAVVSVLLGSYWLNLYFKKFVGTFMRASFYAYILQLSQVATALLILFAIGEFNFLVDYLLIFLVSSVVSVLPLSIGGIGAREITFLYCLQLLQSHAVAISVENAIALSVMFFLFTAISSLFGAFYSNIKAPASLSS